MGSIGDSRAEPIVYTPVAPTKQVQTWAQLQTIDLSKFDQGPEAKKALATQLGKVMSTQGFIVCQGHGFSEAEIERITNIGWTAFQGTSDEEKRSLKAPMVEEGSYRGFKLRGHFKDAGGVGDKIEQFGWFRSMKGQKFPSSLQPFMGELEDYSKRMHCGVLHKLLALFAIALELPEDTFINKTQFDKNDQSWLRITAYYDEYTEEEKKKVGNVWLRGHCDFNLVSLLFSQSMATLQVQDHSDPNMEWRYVPHIPGAMIVNCGHFMEWYSGNYFKAAIHRVVAPPDDQRGHPRVSLFMFVVPNDEEMVHTLDESPVVKNYEGYTKAAPVQSERFARARIAKVGQTAENTATMKAGEKLYQIIDGVKLPLFG